ncbi:hypothetical protein KMW28_06090 [Flammeovirga yaeyamensis]|uniref:Uncharacterized protein n=1 Tax=Flammeovirga yaeyamensis TaxID=367791 RepID=A0AAX1N6G9_9BACT|nr:hypothetical protein [Flammeovirga yaeyamensis]MBB3697741.1 hypothetical protein [Flammeovirga yaeyamensis]NMF35902.1 hypothetical protein [Flammeovirga yaeyamensis]QWG03148.1 hypothetical protein KMW28_06090 [Flammeovirga yaeyamensis]
MTNKTKIIVLISIISIIELLLIKPIIPAFYGMNLMWKSLYAISLFGFPILIIIPIALLVAPLALLLKRNHSFKSVWLRYTQNTFLVFGIVILAMNTLLMFSKFVKGNDPFPLTKYSEIEGYAGNTDDLRAGLFENQLGMIIRDEQKQIERDYNGDSTIYKIEWISNNEYRLIHQGENRGMNDTLDVKITSNTAEYYDCYLRFGEYADYQQIWKK